MQVPEGCFAYHYRIEYWDKFDVDELDRAPEWDGHTADDVTRLFSLLKRGCDNLSVSIKVPIHCKISASTESIKEEIEQSLESAFATHKPMSLLDETLYGLRPDEAIFKLHDKLGWSYDDALHFVTYVWRKDDIKDIIYYEGDNLQFHCSQK
mgnify:CR=1 FL=1